MKKIRHRFLPILFALLLGSAGTILAQNAALITATGTVGNAFQGKLAGIKVTSSNGNHEALTDSRGSFVLPMTDGSTSVVAQANGYFTTTVALPEGDTPTLSIILEKDVNARDQVIEMGYARQRRNAIVGAVSTVTGSELERAPVANLTQTLAGRLPGLIALETYSELSRATTQLRSRGANSIRGNGPLALIDGILVSYNVGQTLEYINPTEIESITYLKDASSMAIHGIQSAHGLLVVTTKRGVKGGLQISGRVDKSFQQATTTPIQYSSYDYAIMRNQAAVNDGNDPYFWYSQNQVEGYQAGTDLEQFPNHNWHNTFIRPWTAMERVSMNFTGGSEAVQFFSNINFMHQDGIFKTDQDRYNPNANNIWVNFRSNIDMRLARRLKGYIRLSGNVKRERTPGSDVNSVYNSIAMLPPTMNGPLTPVVLNPDTGLPTAASGQVVTTDRIDSPTFGMLNRAGYIRHTVTNINSQFGLDQDLGFVTKGLSANGQFVFQTNSVGHLRTTQDYERYVRTSNRDEVIFQRKGSQQNTPLAYGKNSSYYFHISYKASLDYARKFGKHSVTGMGYFFFQTLTRSDLTGGGNILPYNRLHLGVDATYGYDDKYFLQANLGVSGSEQYSSQRRFTDTPSIGAAWVASNEEFLKDSHWLTYLKLRGSYGITATDRSGLARYSYLDNITVSNGGRVPYLGYTVNENTIGNPFLTAEKVRMQNVGFDLGLFKTFHASVDVFHERMNNMVVSAIATIPAFQGIPLDNYPQTNSGQFENKGFELSVGATKQLNKNFLFSVNGYIARNHNTVVSINEARRTDDFEFPLRTEGQSLGQAYGYRVDYSNGNGFFNTQEELAGSPLEYTMGTPRLGDLKYVDSNGDGIIDERDQVPVGNGAIPRTTYGLNGEIRYKAFDLNFLFQGVGNFAQMIGGTGVFETAGDGVYGSLHQDAWTPERYASGAEIRYPALSTVATVNHQASDFFLYNMAFLRLKNMEVGYTLPAHVSQVIRADRVRVLLSGQNLLTWDKMKTNDFGPEGGGFQGIPVYRVFNAGITVTF